VRCNEKYSLWHTTDQDASISCDNCKCSFSILELLEKQQEILEALAEKLDIDINLDIDVDVDVADGD
jgi:hypothetical protein